MVGTSFVKQYYKVLSTAPDQVFRFYLPNTSVFSQGVGSQPTVTAVFQQLEQLKDRFYMTHESCPIRFEFEHGAIDAQLSMNGGVLLVVTGHVVYLTSDYEDDDEVDQRKAFVHTFFLEGVMVGAKRSYYVHNDVLRFLHEGDETVSVKIKKQAVTVVDEEVPVIDVALSEEAEASTVISHVVADAAPGGGVEETKDQFLEENLVPGVLLETEVAVEDAEGSEKGDEEFPVESRKPAGSWASLVARSGGGTVSTSSGGGGTSTSTPTSTPVRSTKTTVSSTTTNPLNNIGVKPTSSSSVTKAVEPPRRKARDPECTLVIKHISDGTTDEQITALIQPFVGDAVVLGTTVSAGKGIAFVDFGSAAPVLAAVEQHQKKALQLNDRVLDVYQKTAEQRARRGPQVGGGSVGRNASSRGGGNGSAQRGGGGAGRHQNRRGGRGERGGRGGRGAGTGQ
jgi:hypothetical protein